ncbi:hypothetical protein [Leisingera thetidis]|uniref:hypothetical protein n=1 Tax=Leisingera thetidis TaxID=2930199 RepID=UPI0021F6C5DA|nr:hypothetical protein [Leisingera thetidis]
MRRKPARLAAVLRLAAGLLRAETALIRAELARTLSRARAGLEQPLRGLRESLPLSKAVAAAKDAGQGAAGCALGLARGNPAVPAVAGAGLAMLAAADRRGGRKHDPRGGAGP